MTKLKIPQELLIELGRLIENGVVSIVYNDFNGQIQINTNAELSLLLTSEVQFAAINHDVNVGSEILWRALYGDGDDRCRGTTRSGDRCKMQIETPRTPKEMETSPFSLYCRFHQDQELNINS